MKKLNEKRKILKKHVASKLIKRLRIFIVIISIILSIIIYKIFSGELGVFLAVVGLLLGTSIGLIAGRMFKLFWQSETEKVVSSLDTMGAIFLLLYIIIEISKKWFFSHWLQGAELNAFSLIFLAGLLLGRLLAMIKGIKKVLLEESKI